MKNELELEKELALNPPSYLVYKASISEEKTYESKSCFFERDQ